MHRSVEFSIHVSSDVTDAYDQDLRFGGLIGDDVLSNAKTADSWPKLGTEDAQIGILRKLGKGRIELRVVRALLRQPPLLLGVEQNVTEVAASFG